MFLKSSLLSSVRPFYAPDDEKGVEKSEADKQREGIKVTNSNDKDEKKEDDDKDKLDKDDDKEGKQEEKDDDEEGDEKGDDKEDDDEKEEEKELTPEQKEVAKLQKTIERLQKRIGKTTGEKAAIAKELGDAKKSLEAKAADGEGLTEEEVERRAEIKANEKVNQREFDNNCKKLSKDALKIDKDFTTKVQEMAEEVKPIPPFFIGVLSDLDNGGAVLAHLANNVDEYEELFELNPAQLTRRLGKISDKLLDEAKPVIKKISKVPDPPEKNLKGNQSSPGVLHDKMSDKEWIEARNRQVADRARQKREAMR